MNEKQFAKLIREQRPEPPMGYEVRMEARIVSLLEEESAVKRGIRFKGMLAAAVLLIILTGTALAMGYPYIM